MPADPWEKNVYKLRLRRRTFPWKCSKHYTSARFPAMIPPSQDRVSFAAEQAPSVVQSAPDDLTGFGIERGKAGDVNRVAMAGDSGSWSLPPFQVSRERLYTNDFSFHGFSLQNIAC